MGTTVIWREMIFDFIILIAVGFFFFNYLRRGGGYAGSFWCNPVGVGATALVEFVVQVSGFTITHYTTTVLYRVFILSTVTQSLYSLSTTIKWINAVKT